MLFGNIIQSSAAVLSLQAGTISAPSIAVIGDLDTGVAQISGANTISAVAGGAEVFAFGATNQARAAINMNANALTGLATPSSASDAATKIYVDNLVQGISAKYNSRVATTAALASNVYDNGASGVGATLTASVNSALPNIDSVSLVLNDYVLVKNETPAINNGLYKVTNLGSGAVKWVLTRADDMDISVEFPGAFTFVAEGTINAATGWLCTVAESFVVGSNNATFTQFSAAGSYTAGNGIVIVGQSIAAKVTATTVTTNGGGALIVNSSATSGQVLLSAGATGTEATWGALDLSNASATTATLALTKLNIAGGTAAAPSAAANLVPFYDTVGTANKVMTLTQLASSTAFTSLYLPLSGGTMTSPIVFNVGGTQITTVSQALSLAPASAATGLGLNLTAGAATAGAGGTVTITGTAGVGTNQNGGNVLLIPGAATGSGTQGLVQINGGSNSFTLPGGRGTAGQVLQTNGAGVTSWVTAPFPYRTTFTNATLATGVLTATHSLGQQYCQVVIYDNTGKMIMPDQVTATSTTVVTVDLTSFGTLTGTWNIVVIG